MNMRDCVYTLKKADYDFLMTVLPLYIPHEGQTICGIFKAPQSGHVEVFGNVRLSFCRRRIAVFDFDFCHLGNAIVRLLIKSCILSLRAFFFHYAQSFHFF